MSLDDEFAVVGQNRRRWGVGIAAVLLLCLGWTVFSRQISRGETFQVERGDVEEALHVPGWVEPVEGVVEVATTAAGVVTSLPVKVGDPVTVGQIVATLDREEAVTRVAQARASVQQAEANAATLRAFFVELESTGRTIEQAAEEILPVVPHLPSSSSGGAAAEGGGAGTGAGAGGAAAGGSMGEGIAGSSNGGAAAPGGGAAIPGGATLPGGGAAAGDTRALPDVGGGSQGGNPGASSAAMNAGNLRSRREALGAAQAGVAAARAQLAQAQSALGRTQVRAPVSGIVIRRNVDVGELVGGLVPTSILAIADVRHLQVRLELDESDIGRVKVGQRGYVTTPATGTAKIPGTISDIAFELGRRKVPVDDPRARTDTRVLEAILKVEAPGPLRIQQRVDVAVILSTAKNVLRIPVRGVFHEGGQAYVRAAGVLIDAARPVTLGVSDGVWVEVREGADERDTLYMDPAVRQSG